MLQPKNSRSAFTATVFPTGNLPSSSYRQDSALTGNLPSSSYRQDSALTATVR